MDDLTRDTLVGDDELNMWNILHEQVKSQIPAKVSTKLPKVPKRVKSVGLADEKVDIAVIRDVLVNPDEMDWVEDPVTFREFCESPEHQNLMPPNWKEGDDRALSSKQYADCLAMLGEDPKKMFSPQHRKYTFAGILWSKGCLHKDIEIRDEKDGKVYTIEQLYKEQKLINVHSFDIENGKSVVKQVSEIHSKGFSSGYKITFYGGWSKIVGEEHKFCLSTLEWSTAKDLKAGQRVKVKVKALSSPKIVAFRDVEIRFIERVEPFEVFDITVPDTECYFDADGFLHHNSGKDFICSIIQAYLVHVLLCLRNPGEFFGFGKGESCDILNVGQKGLQARRVYFNKFRARLLDWPWLRQRYNIIDDGKKLFWNGPEFPTCTLGKDFAEWKGKNVRAYSESSNPEGFEGYNIVFYLCDEISGWVSPAERAVAEKCLNILQSSQVSRNTKTLCGLGMAISYPRQDDDIMFKIKKDSQKKDSKTYWSEGYAWDVKPKRFYSGEFFDFNAGLHDRPEVFKIPVELKDEFDNNPEDCKCKYLLRPPAVGSPFFELTDKVDGICSDERKPLFKVEKELIQAKDKDGIPIYYVRKILVGLARQPDPSVDYVFWLDAAESNCDAALSVGHKEVVTVQEGSVRRDVEVVVIDQTVVWEPDQASRHIVDIGSMTTFCLTAKNFITVAGVFWDMWNSGTGIFDLRSAGIVCDKHNLVGTDYSLFKSVIYTNRFVAPKDVDYVKGVEQVKHLSRTRTNNVEPGSKFHKKDISDTWCGITSLLLGKLAGSMVFRPGRVPTGSSLGAGITAGMATGYSGVAASAASNPFSGGMSKMGKGIISNHSDLFPGVMGLGKGRVRSPGRTGQSTPTANPGNRKFPGGITMG